jgi:hypothetical protein
VKQWAHTVLPFFLLPPGCIDSLISRPDEAKDPAGEDVLRLIQIRLTTWSFEEISLGCQDNSLYKIRRKMRIALGIDENVPR